MGLNYRGRRISVKTYSVVRDMASYAVTGAVVLLVSAEPQIKTTTQVMGTRSEYHHKCIATWTMT